ncbi:MAG TPA: hypothetical protein VOA00_00890, partial [Thermoanaerobaculia bacterium]|nr:hypothetical protein [Thermoanaerobaculia bacterium]
PTSIPIGPSPTSATRARNGFFTDLLFAILADAEPYVTPPRKARKPPACVFVFRFPFPVFRLPSPVWP